MVVIITYKFDENSIKNKISIIQTFSEIYQALKGK